ncbi:MAG: phytanoyl-CoA dioxygenase family protein [candidate division FCPU426 bacterium]
MQKLTSLGRELDQSPEKFGVLRDSNDALQDPLELRKRMAEDGYLYLPGYLDKAQVMATRREMTGRLAAEGSLDPAFDPMEAVLKPGLPLSLRSDLAKNNAPMHELLYTGRMMDFYRALLGGEVLHYDYTWVRAVAPGKGTPPHLDIVYMGRGTSNLFTAWVPIGDVTFDLGGLMVLEGSHRLKRLKETYGQRDVDSYCSNRPEAEKYASGEKWWNGWLSNDPVQLQKTFGGRWLTTEYKVGDLLTFSMFTIHASLDNPSKHVRFSTDSRYQLASEPADERWIGQSPPGHGKAGKRGKIC